MANILEPGEMEDAQFQQFLLQAAAKEGLEIPGHIPEGGGMIPSAQVVPQPGFCLKTKTDKGEKAFINVCYSENVPAPKEMTEEELLKMLDSDDPFGFRVPMSLGEPHAEIDKSRQGCTAFDVVVNPSFLEKMKNSEVFKAFFISVTLEGIEEKYSITLKREWVILKNRKFIGSLPEQRVRTQSKPLIMEMEENKTEVTKTGKVLDAEELKLRGEKPEFRIVQEPVSGHPEFLVAEISLPKCKTSSSLSLDIGEDRILLQTRSNVYYLDIYLPYFLDQDGCGAQFNRKTKILTITMPVQPS